MNILRFTLVSDGSSDRVLLAALKWLLIQNGVVREIDPIWADLRRHRRSPRKLSDRIRESVGLFPCDLLFVHRDSEAVALATRKREIEAALRAARVDTPSLCVIPVRMSEAWLLFDENAIRHAADNPGGQVRLDLPRLARLESIPDPKSCLHRLIRKASELSGRRQKGLNVESKVHRIAELIEDFRPLRALTAFREVEEDIRRAIDTNGWNRRR